MNIKLSHSNWLKIGLASGWADANEEIRTVKWTCPKTGVYLIAHFTNNELLNGYDLFAPDKSFIDNYDNFYHPRNYARKHYGAELPRLGKEVSH